MRLAVSLLVVLLLSPRWGVAAGRNQDAAADRFSREVLPLLSDRCFHCHGPDASHREAELRLDVEAAAKEDRGGYRAVAPGDVDASEIWARITSDDPELMMPPPDSHRQPLSSGERQTVRRWIEQGATWGRHWSFEPPVRPHVPDDVEHPIDYLVRQRLRTNRLRAAPPARPHQRLRRVSFDLTGLPPTAEERESFLRDSSAEAYVSTVDRLLDSPHYGERMAMWWLDLARYADTDGYQQDATRNNWPWRDWVVESFNANMPFDQFTIEQFAGDLLPEATEEQILATCFHRNHMTNGEGGRDPEESRIDYVMDRVNTTGTVWLGLTVGCSQCHSHKFDPITQADYYSMFAFFNSIDEDGKAGSAAKPYLTVRSPYAARALEEAQAVVDARQVTLDALRHAAEETFRPWLATQLERVRDGFSGWRPLHVRHVASVEGTVLRRREGVIQAEPPSRHQDDFHIHGTSELRRVTGIRLDVLPHASHTGGRLSHGESGLFVLTDVKLQVRRQGASQVRDVELAAAVADAELNVKGRNYGRVKDTLDDDPRNGWTVDAGVAQQPHTAIFALREPLVLADDEELVFVMLHRSTTGHGNTGRFRVSVTDQPGRAVRSLEPMPLEQLASAAPRTAAEIDEALRTRLFEQFLEDQVAYQAALRQLNAARRQRDATRRAAGDLKVMVLAERETPRTTHILERGVWDAKGDVVRSSVPAAVLDWPRERLRSRLDLARWLVDRANPLTARVAVNQLWQLCFGHGLVRTPEDFGLQGELPAHPELLDWLAVEFMESGWNVKHLLRLIVTSGTYQQSSQITAMQRESDPENRWLARGPRFRLPSWMIRDAALRSSGLLNPALGGPPVRPYQPPGVWEEIFMGRFTYEPSQGPAQYRRSLYAFWRRSAAPTFLFDSAQRRVCEVRPHQTNTPLHALTLLNDLNLLAPSRALATRAIGRFPEADDRLINMFRAVLSRPPTTDELAVLRRELQRSLTYYREHRRAAETFLSFGQPEERPVNDVVQVAACTVVASLIYNLDEAITHE